MTVVWRTEVGGWSELEHTAAGGTARIERR